MSHVGGDPVRLPSLSGLRVPAAFVVFAHHLVAFVPSPDWAARLTTSAMTSLSFFFVLSGFVLAWSARPGDTAAAFLRRRATRILPLYWIAFVIGGALALVLGINTVVQLLPSVVLVQAWFPDAGVHFAGNSVGWSLSVEALFYVGFPFMLVALRRLGRVGLWVVLVVAVALAAGLPVWFAPQSYDGLAYWFAYIFPITRVPEFVAGVALALLMRSGVRVPIPMWLPLVVASSCMFVANWLPITLHTVGATIVPFVVLIAAAAEGDRGGRPSVFAHPVLVRAGDCSFAFYLVHLLAIRMAWAVNERTVDLDWWVVGVVALVATLVTAWFAHRWIEVPLERRWRSPRRRYRALSTPA
ncbi:MAG: acyltransferase family protein [Curtobacterium sp.]